MKYECPVCCFEMAHPPKDYNICPCCGTEFDNDDVEFTIAELRSTWIIDGAQFWFPEECPKDWDRNAQLSKLAI
jgi:hypothetical protein